MQALALGHDTTLKPLVELGAAVAVGKIVAPILEALHVVPSVRVIASGLRVVVLEPCEVIVPTTTHTVDDAQEMLDTVALLPVVTGTKLAVGVMGATTRAFDELVVELGNATWSANGCSTFALLDDEALPTISQETALDTHAMPVSVVLV